MTPFVRSAGMSAAALMALSACVSVLPEQARPEAVFTLGTPETQRPLAATVIIREPDAPRLFASRSIAAEGADDGLRVVPGIAWADRSTRMLQVTMVESFSSEGGGLAVDDATGVSGAYELYWRVTDFTLKGDEGHCALSLTLLDGRSREPVEQASVTSTTASTGKGPVPRAQALAAAGRACVAKGADFVAAHALAPAEPAGDAPSR